jgi:hypothetical protein
VCRKRTVFAAVHSPYLGTVEWNNGEINAVESEVFWGVFLTWPNGKTFSRESAPTDLHFWNLPQRKGHERGKWRKKEKQKQL